MLGVILDRVVVNRCELLSQIHCSAEPAIVCWGADLLRRRRRRLLPDEGSLSATASSGLPPTSMSWCIPSTSFFPISESAAEARAGVPLFMDRLTSREYGRIEMIRFAKTSWTSLILIPTSSSTLLRMTLTESLSIRSLSRVLKKDAHVSNAWQVECDHAQHASGMVECGKHDLGELSRRVNDDVIEALS